MSLPLAIPKRSTIVVLAMIALAAMVAASILAGGAPVGAQHDDDVHVQPDACSDTISPVVSSGRIALFDVFFNPDEGDHLDYETEADLGTLVSNPCPPVLTYVPQQEVDREIIEAHEDRAGSSVDISQTIIHIPSSYKREPPLSLTSAQDQLDYPFLFLDKNDADGQPYPEGTADAEKDGVADTLVSDEVWVLPDCKPGSTTTASDLCLIFSAGLLFPDHWRASADAAQDDYGDIQYEFASLRHPGLGTGDRGYAFVYFDDGDDTTANEATWETNDVGNTELSITPGTYEYPRWLFTKPGTYVFAVQAKGHPVVGHTTETIDRTTATSEVRNYVLHVGPLADLSVDVSVSNATPDIGETVDITVAASNSGPDDAEDALVHIALGDGLTFVSSDTDRPFYEPSTGIWTLQDPFGNGAREEIVLTASVDGNTHGKQIGVRASIAATDTIGNSRVPELDPNRANNTDTEYVVPVATPNVKPMFQVVRSVQELSSGGTLVGAVIPVVDANPGDTLTYSLIGDTDRNFVVSAVAGGVQVSVAENAAATLDHETTPVYNMTLQVSDGLDEDGNVDATIDHTIALRVNVTDGGYERFVSRLVAVDPSPVVGASAVFRSYTQNAPADTTYNLFIFDGAGQQLAVIAGPGVPPDPYTPGGDADASTAGERRYYLRYFDTPAGDEAPLILETSNTVALDWQAMVN